MTLGLWGAVLGSVAATGLLARASDRAWFFGVVSTVSVWLAMSSFQRFLPSFSSLATCRAAAITRRPLGMTMALSVLKRMRSQLSRLHVRPSERLTVMRVGRPPDSTLSVSPCCTRYCLPPVVITAYMSRSPFEPRIL
jgi:hypothetical protein